MPNEIKVSPKRDSLRLALAQLNPVVGDIDGNLKKARAARAEASAKGADLIAFTELYLTGYPIEDLVLKPAFQQAAREACEAFARDTSGGGPAVLIGLPWAEGPFVYNAVAYLDRGRIEAVRLKYNLPNYGVFDEKRVFAPGPLPEPIDVRGVSLGVPVCEDIWSEEACRALAKAGAGLLIVPNGSPYWMDKQGQRYSIAQARIAETGLPLAYVNQVGGQDELVFDGASFVLNADGILAVQMPAWEEALGVTEWLRQAAPVLSVLAPFGHAQRLFPRRHLHGEVPSALSTKEAPSNTELILTSDLIDIGKRQAGLGDARLRDRIALTLLVHPIGRAIRHDEKPSACLRQRSAHLLAPDVLTHRHAERTPLTSIGSGSGPGANTRFSSNTP